MKGPIVLVEDQDRPLVWIEPVGPLADPVVRPRIRPRSAGRGLRPRSAGAIVRRVAPYRRPDFGPVILLAWIAATLVALIVFLEPPPTP